MVNAFKWDLEASTNSIPKEKMSQFAKVKQMKNQMQLKIWKSAICDLPAC